ESERGGGEKGCLARNEGRGADRPPPRCNPQRRDRPRDAPATAAPLINRRLRRRETSRGDPRLRRSDAATVRRRARPPLHPTWLDTVRRRSPRTPLARPLPKWATFAPMVSAARPA